MKTKRTYKRGRSIAGWAYGQQITDVVQVHVGDYLIGDSHCFQATNLYRVTKILRDVKAKPCGVIVIYVRPSRRQTGENAGMCVWHWMLDRESYSYYHARKRRQKIHPERR